MALIGNAALTYTDPRNGQEVIHRLNAPLRNLAPRHDQWRSVRTSLDRSVTQVVTIGDGMHELVGRIRYDDMPNALLAMLVHAANGLELTYIPDLARSTSYTARLIPDGNVVGIAPDSDRWMWGEYEATIVLRRKASFAGLLGRTDGMVICWEAGQSWADAHFTRTTDAYTRDRAGFYVPVGADVPRSTWRVDPATGLLMPRTLTEPAGTNLLPNSSNFGPSGTGWVAAADWTIEPVTSVIKGQTAWRHTNLATNSGRSRYREMGVLTGAPESLWVIVENVNAVTTDINLNDLTVNSPVCRARLTWATGEVTLVSGAGAVWGECLGIGPNGGPLYLLALTATGIAGNARRPLIYLTGPLQNTDTAILHHAQLEAGGVTTPIVTGAAGGDYRAADALYLDLPPEIQKPGTAMAVYARCVVGASGVDVGNHPGVWSISNGTSTAPSLRLQLSSTSRQARLSHFNNQGINVGTGSAVATAGDLLETLSLIWTDSAGMLTGRLIASVNGDPLAGDDLPPLAPAAAWSAPRLYVGSRGTAPGVYEWEAFKVRAGRLSVSDREILDFMRQAKR